MDGAIRERLVDLLASWRDWSDNRSWYLTEHLPRIVAEGSVAGRDSAERRRIASLQRLLDDEQWSALALLLVRVEKSAERDVLILRRKHDAQAKLERRRRQESELRRREQIWDEEQRKVVARRQAEKQAEQEARAELLARLGVELESRFLGARDWLRINDPGGLVDDGAYADAAESYVTRWCAEFFGSSDSEGSPFAPDREQARVIASVTGNVLVAARAGSGKTSTMVARAAFLIVACGVDPSEILLLAFNVSAADEIRDRLERILKGRRVPHVMTFHALAHRLVHPAENLLYDSSPTVRPLSSFVQEVVNTFVRDPDTQGRVREVMIEYFRRDWNRVADRGDTLTPAQQVEYRRHLQDETIKGDFVKSYGEKRIANFLFENGLDYGYEHDVRWNGQNYKPDFSVYDVNKRLGVVIEYFGMIGDPEYDAQSVEKRNYWAGRSDVRFFEYTPTDVADPGFAERLRRDLTDAGAPLTQLTDVELWERIKKRAVDRFTETVTTVIGRARQRRWSGRGVLDAWESMGFHDPHLHQFMELASELLDSYVSRLAAAGKEDFTGLLWRAVDEVHAGTTEFGRAGTRDGDLRRLRYIVVDEFQDFSEMFFELLRQVRAKAPGVGVMAVGDDWQAINEFAGSTVQYFREFDQYFDGANELTISTNRRSAGGLVHLGNSVMEGRGTPARSLRTETGRIRELKVDAFEPSPMEQDLFGQYDRSTPALLRLIQNHLRHGRSVAVLARRRNVGYSITVKGDERTFSDFGKYGAYLRKLLGVEGPDQVRFSSTHGFKGQEADAVILLDVNNRSYPLIHPTWALYQVFGDTIRTLTEAERRLFYVGVSRPRTHLDIVTTDRSPSDFWTAVRKTMPIAPSPWGSLPEVQLPGHESQIEIRVRNGRVANFNEVRKQLKEHRFRFQGSGENYWWLLVDAQRFDESEVLAAEWAHHPGIHVEAWCAGQRLLDHRIPGGRSDFAPF